MMEEGEAQGRKVSKSAISHKEIIRLLFSKSYGGPPPSSEEEFSPPNGGGGGGGGRGEGGPPPPPPSQGGSEEGGGGAAAGQGQQGGSQLEVEEATPEQKREAEELLEIAEKVQRGENLTEMTEKELVWLYFHLFSRAKEHFVCSPPRKNSGTRSATTTPRPRSSSWRWQSSSTGG